MPQNLFTGLLPRLRRAWSTVVFLLLLLSTGPRAGAALQFDVFLGYDGVVPEASWFPVVCEINNDGPAFNAIFEISSGNFGQNQERRMVLELPTNTRKRLLVPLYSTSRNASWNFRLLDEKGTVRAEDMNKRPRRQLNWDVPIVGMMSRSRAVAGVPMLPPIKAGEISGQQPMAVRLSPAYFPDNPIVLEGLKVIYLNSEAALTLKDNQMAALRAWMESGGHLVIAVEAVNDLEANPWLREMVPADFSQSTTVKPGNAFQQWLEQGTLNLAVKRLAADAAFAGSSMPVVQARPRDGQVRIKAGEVPLMISAPRGRGQVTLLTFSPEREPFLSWTRQPWFWASLAEVPAPLYENADMNHQGGWSVDGIFGSLIDSKQVRKLPLGWLLLLLVTYLVVIGPLDHWWLKKINRQMLTWLTFPCYVLFFSGLIYYIGFRLRAGDTEWNELHLVDLLPRGEQAVLRGRTYSSVYSPVNASYAVEGDQPFSTWRGETLATWGSGEERTRSTVMQRGNNFTAEIFVPVWTSQLFVSDWLQPGPMPLGLQTSLEGNTVVVQITNHLDRSLPHAWVVVKEKVHDLGALAAKSHQRLVLQPGSGMPLQEFVSLHGSAFFNAISSRNQSFSRGHENLLADSAVSSVASSFVSLLNKKNGHESFVVPEGLDLSAYAQRGETILLAWDEDHTPTSPFNRFTTRRSHRQTLLRLVAAAPL